MDQTQPQQAQQSEQERQELAAIDWSNLFSKLQQIMPILLALLEALGNSPKLRQELLEKAYSQCTPEQRRAIKQLGS